MGSCAFGERLAMASLPKALRGRAWLACGGLPGRIQPEEGSSTGRAGGMLSAGRGVLGQLRPAPGSRRAEQKQTGSCDRVSPVGEL